MRVDVLRLLVSPCVPNPSACRQQIVWGEQPGYWPQDWMVTQGMLEGELAPAASPAPSGLSFQVCAWLCAR